MTSQHETNADASTPAAADDERPPFLDALPDDPQLNAIAAAFSQGNYAEVRRRVPLLVKSSKDDNVIAAALDFERRIAPDPLIKYLLLVSALLLLVLVIFAYGHAH